MEEDEGQMQSSLGLRYFCIAQQPTDVQMSGSHRGTDTADHYHLCQVENTAFRMELTDPIMLLFCSKNDSLRFSSDS